MLLRDLLVSELTHVGYEQDEMFGLCSASEIEVLLLSCPIELEDNERVLMDDESKRSLRVNIAHPKEHPEKNIDVTLNEEPVGHSMILFPKTRTSEGFVWQYEEHALQGDAYEIKYVVSKGDVKIAYFGLKIKSNSKVV